MQTIEDYNLIENNSIKYKNGSKWTNIDGYTVTIIGKTNKMSNNKLIYYLCIFESGTLMEIQYSNLYSGSFKTPFSEMKYIKELNGYKVYENKSKIYHNGSKWETNKYGNFIIIGRADPKENDYAEYLCQFEDGTITKAQVSHIINGSIKNKNLPNICGFGFIGEGKYNNIENRREYKVFCGVLRRCYCVEDEAYKYYGAKGVILDKELHNFQNFCEMFINLPNYDKWKNEGGWQLDKDILCDKLNIFPKIYSKDTCQLIKKHENSIYSSLTGLTYVAHRISNGYEEEFTNQTKFAQKYNLKQSGVNACIHKKQKTHRGWKFFIKN